MSLNSTPSSERIHIGFFGRTNAGKSSVVNSITGQNVSIVSEFKGTTTDPVYKAMELLPLGPVSIIDTPGIDDEGKLGKLRIEKTKQILKRVDIAILIVDASIGISQVDNDLISVFNENNTKYIVVYNKLDLISDKKQLNSNEIYVSAKENKNIFELKELIATCAAKTVKEQPLVKDLVSKNDIVILVTPIDESAPKGRLILPQQQVIRELLEVGTITLVVQVNELEHSLNLLNKKPKVVITDSQVFDKVNELLPDDVFLTSFSILFARYKGILKTAVQGVKQIEFLEDDDIVLISEGCTHHRQCNDIGTVKLPTWIKKYTGKNLNFEFTSGIDFKQDLSKYKMVIHCGGCMLKDLEVQNRYRNATKHQLPITNYGITIAYMNGILKRSVEIFSDIYSVFE